MKLHDATAVALGRKQADAVYLGREKVWPPFSGDVPPEGYLDEWYEEGGTYTVQVPSWARSAQIVTLGAGSPGTVYTRAQISSLGMIQVVGYPGAWCGGEVDVTGHKSIDIQVGSGKSQPYKGHRDGVLGSPTIISNDNEQAGNSVVRVGDREIYAYSCIGIISLSGAVSGTASVNRFPSTYRQALGPTGAAFLQRDSDVSEIRAQSAIQSAGAKKQLGQYQPFYCFGRLYRAGATYRRETVSQNPGAPGTTFNYNEYDRKTQTDEYVQKARGGDGGVYIRWLAKPTEHLGQIQYRIEPNYPKDAPVHPMPDTYERQPV